MGWFSNDAPKPEIRRDKVRKILQAAMAETDAGDRGLDTPEWVAADEKYKESMRGATQDEIRAALDAARRHGY
jgi:hypothetical protein